MGQECRPGHTPAWGATLACWRCRPGPAWPDAGRAGLGDAPAWQESYRPSRVLKEVRPSRGQGAGPAGGRGKKARRAEEARGGPAGTPA
jgi:hypothetical protein